MLQGVFSVLPTPFQPDQSIDVESLKRVIDLYLRAEVSGLTASGVTSEVARLSDKERVDVFRIVMEHVDGRVPVVIGTSTQGVRTCIELTKLISIIFFLLQVIEFPLFY